MNIRHFVIIPGQPVAKGRPRFSRYGHAYTPGKTARWADRASVIMRDVCGTTMMDGPLKLEVIAVFQRPKNRYRKCDPDGRFWHTVKPDKDNVEKSVSDALQKAGVVRDDSCICTGPTSKFYTAKGEGPCVIVYLEQITDAEHHPTDRISRRATALERLA